MESDLKKQEVFELLFLEFHEKVFNMQSKETKKRLKLTKKISKGLGLTKKELRKVYSYVISYEPNSIDPVVLIKNAMIMEDHLSDPEVKETFLRIQREVEIKIKK